MRKNQMARNSSNTLYDGPFFKMGREFEEEIARLVEEQEE